MNTPSHTLSESPLKARAAALARTPAVRGLYWSLRRELWENRSLYLAPLAVAALVLFGFLVRTLHLRATMSAAPALDPERQHALMTQPYDFAALVIMFTTVVVGVIYSLDALHGERRDRSILFWKSLPVSDLTTVLSKASVPLVVLPLLTFAITVATQLTMVLMDWALGGGVNAASPWAHLRLFRMSLMLFYHLMAVHGLMYWPIFCWLLLVSGWARRAPFLWAGLPLLAIGFVEKIAFNTSHFAAMLMHRIGGGAEGSAGSAMDSLTLMPGKFLANPDLWVGLAVSAAFLAAAVRLRRYQGPI